jgi:hypothetical protein
MDLESTFLQGTGWKAVVVEIRKEWKPVGLETPHGLKIFSPVAPGFYEDLYQG